MRIRKTIVSENYSNTDNWKWISQWNWSSFDPTDATENYKRSEIDGEFHLSSSLTTRVLLTGVMEKKIARVIWSRGRYSDVSCTCIVDPSPLKQGQNVKVLWGKNRKEFSAVIECYPFETSQESFTSGGTLAPRQAKVKRKLVSICFRSNSFNKSEFEIDCFPGRSYQPVALNQQIPESSPAKEKISKAKKGNEKRKGQVCKTVCL